MRRTKAPGIGPFPGQEPRDTLLRREEAAEYLRVSLPTMELWARTGAGPRVTRIGRQVRYRLDDLRTFTGSSEKR
jgi:excisionase family DNA binding protein